MRTNRSLVVGSGPGVDAWWLEHKSYFIDEGYAICPINNAVAVTDADTTIWYRSGNYGGLQPTADVTLCKGQNTLWATRPLWYKQPPGFGGRCECSMFLDTVYFRLNDSVRDGHVAHVVVVGCDMNYDGDQTHFYGKGAPDPLRFGAEWLDTELARIPQVYCAAFSFIYNASEGRSRLPFDRFTGHLSSSEQEQEHAS
jgi:hypothetical protein